MEISFSFENKQKEMKRFFYVLKLNPQNQLDLFSIFREFIHGPENFMGFISRRAKVYHEGQVCGPQGSF